MSDVLHRKWDHGAVHSWALIAMQVSNFCTIQKGLLSQDMQQLESTAEALRQRLDVTVKRFADVTAQAHSIVNTVTKQASTGIALCLACPYSMDGAALCYAKMRLHG